MQLDALTVMRLDVLSTKSRLWLLYQTQSDHNFFYYLKVRRVMGLLVLYSIGKVKSSHHWISFKVRVSGKKKHTFDYNLSLLSFTVIVPELNFQVLRLFLTNQFLWSGIFCFVLSSLIQMNSIYYTLWVYGYQCIDTSYSLSFKSSGIPIK